MKALFFVVCLLNLLFFFWELHSGAFTLPASPLSGKPAIMLVSERETARRGAEISAYLDHSVAAWQAKQSAYMVSDLMVRHSDFSKKMIKPSQSNGHKPKPKAETGRCYEIGPFADQAELQRWLSGKSFQAYKTIEKESTEPLDFQVYYPAAKNPEQVRINMLMLKAKGFTDVWPVADGEMKGAVSLGVFNDKQRAGLFKAQLAERGVSAEIRRRTKTKVALFVRLTAMPSALQNTTYSQLPATDCGRAQN